MGMAGGTRRAERETRSHRSHEIHRHLQVGSAEKRRGDRTGGRGGEEKSPHCSDHPDPPTPLTWSRDGVKPPEPQEDPPPTQNTLTLEIQGWRSPLGATDWAFLSLGAPRLLLELVWSDQTVQSHPSWMRQRQWIRARDAGLAFPRMFSTLSPLLDGQVTGVGSRGPRNAGEKPRLGLERGQDPWDTLPVPRARLRELETR
ncbi:uncharacterized protein LOC114071829 [Empidonax traillii]|uniref:uncharacterized protein LOC114071829 n=1 Tax=Empidonax traillii TaxID=164674 RepID=UPI000FFD2DE7|nr:uncharacterized protein LOC114071829 [Empidonax traillii]